MVLTDFFFNLSIRATILRYARSSSPERNCVVCVPLALPPPLLSAETETEHETTSKSSKGTKEPMIGLGRLLQRLDAMDARPCASSSSPSLLGLVPTASSFASSLRLRAVVVAVVSFRFR
jgi:hypothetical protein